MAAGQPQALVAAPQATKPNIVLILAGARFDAPSTVMRPNSVMKNLFLNLKHTMKHTMKHIFLALSLTASLAQPAPVKLVFDTDMGNDVDDLMALCMIHNLQQRGACELLAVTITKDHPQAAAFTDAVNTFFGAPDTPVGVMPCAVL